MNTSDHFTELEKLLVTIREQHGPSGLERAAKILGDLRREDKAAAEPKADEAGRYAASRPAAIFESRPDEGSIFGGGISEQSLDDVILSYIAEDLDEG